MAEGDEAAGAFAMGLEIDGQQRIPGVVKKAQTL